MLERSSACTATKNAGKLEGTHAVPACASGVVPWIELCATHGAVQGSTSACAGELITHSAVTIAYMQLLPAK
jgi:hypothetical protein